MEKFTLVQPHFSGWKRGLTQKNVPQWGASYDFTIEWSKPQVSISTNKKIKWGVTMGGGRGGSEITVSIPVLSLS